jgi:hypothetical protein
MAVPAAGCLARARVTAGCGGGREGRSESDVCPAGAPSQIQSVVSMTRIAIIFV